MPASPYRASCVVAGCGAAVHLGGRCRRHGTVADRLRGLSSDRYHVALYGSAEWRRLRRTLLAASPICVCAGCRADGIVRAATVVHHVTPHGGDRARFFDVSNLLAMSKTCHDRVTGSTREGLSNRPEAAPSPNRLVVSRGFRQVSDTGGPR